MKIATFNINNVNKRFPNLLAWLRSARPDVACLQELKSTDADFPIAALRRAGYEAVWKGQKSWNGVAILAHGTTPIVTRTELPGDPADAQSRPHASMRRLQRPGWLYRREHDSNGTKGSNPSRCATHKPVVI